MADVVIPDIPVKGSIEGAVPGVFEGPFSYLCLNGENPAEITRELRITEELKAPVSKGDEVGNICYSLNGKEVGRVSVIAGQDIKEAGWKDYFMLVFEAFRIL